MSYLSLILITLMLVGCATSQAKYNADMVDYRIEQSMRGYTDSSQKYARDYANSPNVITSNAEYWAARGVAYPPVPSSPQIPRIPPPATPGVSGWDVLGAIVALPILIPIAMITNYPSYRSYAGVHCRSYTYKDAYHTRCY